MGFLRKLKGLLSSDKAVVHAGGSGREQDAVLQWQSPAHAQGTTNASSASTGTVRLPALHRAASGLAGPSPPPSPPQSPCPARTASCMSSKWGHDSTISRSLSSGPLQSAEMAPMQPSAPTSPEAAYKRHSSLGAPCHSGNKSRLGQAHVPTSAQGSMPVSPGMHRSNTTGRPDMSETGSAVALSAQHSEAHCHTVAPIHSPRGTPLQPTLTPSQSLSSHTAPHRLPHRFYSRSSRSLAAVSQASQQQAAQAGAQYSHAAALAAHGGDSRRRSCIVESSMPAPPEGAPLAMQHMQHRQTQQQPHAVPRPSASSFDTAQASLQQPEPRSLAGATHTVQKVAQGMSPLTKETAFLFSTMPDAVVTADMLVAGDMYHTADHYATTTYDWNLRATASTHAGGRPRRRQLARHVSLKDLLNLSKYDFVRDVNVSPAQQAVDSEDEIDLGMLDTAERCLASHTAPCMAGLSLHSAPHTSLRPPAGSTSGARFGCTHPSMAGSLCVSQGAAAGGPGPCLTPGPGSTRFSVELLQPGHSPLEAGSSAGTHRRSGSRGQQGGTSQGPVDSSVHRGSLMATAGAELTDYLDQYNFVDDGEEQFASMPHPVLLPPKDSNVLAVSKAMPRAMKRSMWRVADYQLSRRLHHGYASDVYSGTCTLSGTRVALKVYRLSAQCDLQRVQLYREIWVHSRLEHSNIVQFYAAFLEDSCVVIVQEYLKGGDLLRYMYKQGGRLSEQQAVCLVLLPCLAALDYLHTQGIIHRDIKPENILLSEDNVLKLADFGLAVDLNAERANTRAGTLDYMAPEVLRCPTKETPDQFKEAPGAAHYEMGADAWALGVFCYELVVGSSPFKADEMIQTARNIINCSVQYPQGLSEQARDFISSCLRKHPGDRPTIQQMLQHPWALMHKVVQTPGGTGAEAYAEQLRQEGQAALAQQQLRQQQHHCLQSQQLAHSHSCTLETGMHAGAHVQSSRVPAALTPAVATYLARPASLQHDAHRMPGGYASTSYAPAQPYFGHLGHSSAVTYAGHTGSMGLAPMDPGAAVGQPHAGMPSSSLSSASAGAGVSMGLHQQGSFTLQRQGSASLKSVAWAIDKGQHGGDTRARRGSVGDVARQR